MTTLCKPMNELEKWEALFPFNPTRCYAESSAFVKRLTLSALSTIVFHRNMFARDCFEQYELFNVHVMQLRVPSRSTPPLAAFVSTCWDQAMDAFDKQYLHQLVFSVYADSNDEESRLESYIFTYEYHGESVHLTLQGQRALQKSRTTLAQVQEATERMMRAAIASAEEEEALPPTYDLVVKLIYTEQTPPDYKPEKFEECDAEVEQVVVRASIHTGSHTLLFSKLSLRKLNRSTTPMVSTDQHTPHSSFLSDATPRASGEGSLAAAAASSVDESLYYLVRCPCDSDVRGDDVINSRCILCKYCSRLQHAACFRCYEEEEYPPQHCCETCARERPERVCTDPSLVDLDRSRARARCVFQRALDWCRMEDSVTGALFKNSFRGMTDDGLKKLLHKLEVAGVLRPLPPDQDTMEAPRPVNAAKANEALIRYSASACERQFNRMLISSQEQQLVSSLECDRPSLSATRGCGFRGLAKSTRANVEADPAEPGDGDIPQRQTKLPAAASTSGAHAAPLQPTATKKKTEWLKRLQDVVLSSDEMLANASANEGGEETMETEMEELPLSGSHNPVKVGQLTTVKKAALRRKRKASADDEDYKPSKRIRKAKKY